jgi:hypothetical protein
MSTNKQVDYIVGEIYSEEQDWITGDTIRVLNTALLDELIVDPADSIDDLTAAEVLLELLHQQFEAYGTGGGEWIEAKDIRVAVDACNEVVRRLGLESFEIPFRDYSSFYSWWVDHGAYGSWQARRDLLHGIFEQAERTVRSNRIAERRRRVASGVTPTGRLDWPAFDRLVIQIETRFRSARGVPDYKAVGLDCVTLLDALSESLYDPAQHLRVGETEPPVDQSKNRLDRVVEDAAHGSGNAELRKLIKAAIEYAHHVKHQTTPSRQDAGMAADATILVAHLLRRLVGTEVRTTTSEDSQ